VKEGAFGSALVTGGRSGIGAAVVAALEREGTDVRVLDLVDGFDVSDPAAWESVGAVELACLNAGIGGGSEDLPGYRRMVGVNVDGVVFGVRRLQQVMKPGGVIVATSSLAGLMGMSLDPIYTLTKHAVVGYVRAMAPLLVEQGIRIHAICPGFADTALVVPELRDWIAEQGIPLMTTEQVAEAMLHAARAEETGGVWVVQPGREPIRYEFRGVPGPR
jgi:NAD(P)-dependent dehydrogenase (short-subunit alcohol dehydrogenase family)